MASHGELSKSSTGISAGLIGSGHDDKTIEDSLGIHGIKPGQLDETQENPHDETHTAKEPRNEDIGRAIDELESKETSWFAYLKTRDFYIVLLLGYDIYPINPSARHA